MSWVWFDLCPGPVTDALASAAAYDEQGREIGTLAAWRHDVPRPSPSAAKVDQRAVDPSGAAGWVSWARGADGLFLPFDDPAVAQATRMVMSMPPAGVFSTLVEGDDRCVGALTATYGDRRELTYDPFANLFPTIVLRVEAGVLGRMPAPTGPVTQRYGADNPWPWDRF